MKKITEMKWYEREYEEICHMVPKSQDDENEILSQIEKLIDRCKDEGIDDDTVLAMELRLIL